MGHIEDSCDIIDVLEEAVTTRRTVAIQMEGGRAFTDHVTDVVTQSGQDFAEFKTHGFLPVRDIRSAARIEPLDGTYAGKPLRRHAPEEREEDRAHAETLAQPETASPAVARTSNDVQVEDAIGAADRR